MGLLKSFKPALLAVLIVVGLTVNAKEVHAAETEVLTVAGGCFWCVEADFEKVRGVSEVVSGYTGGKVENPTYEQVVRGGTGHYEAVQIRFDPDAVSREQLLHLFFRSIDPLDAGGQFCDRGESYRSAIFVDGPAERRLATDAKDAAATALGQDIVTPILEEGPFYRAEDYHQDYYKSDERIAFTSVGIGVPKRVAYNRYRDRCGRDARVRELWGEAAAFAGG